MFTTRLAEARRFYGEILGLNEIFANDTAVMFDTGQAKLIVEHIDADHPEARELVGRFAAFSFTVADMETARRHLRRLSVEWLGPPERQAWGEILSHIKDPDGNVLTLVQYPQSESGPDRQD